MKKLSVYMLTAAAALAVTGAAPAATYAATVTYNVPARNGNMTVIGGSNMGDLQGVLDRLGANLNFSGCTNGQNQGQFGGCTNGQNQCLPGGCTNGQNQGQLGGCTNGQNQCLPGGCTNGQNCGPTLPEIPGGNLPDISLPEPGLPTPGLPNDSTQDRPGAGSGQDEFANQVVRLVNAERAKAGLGVLTVDTRAVAAAQTRAEEIERSFSHVRPDGSSFSTALTQAGASYRSAGENIAYGQQSPEEVMQGWMNSSGHRANILNSGFTSIGVGHYRNAAGVDYWTQMFMN